MAHHHKSALFCLIFVFAVITAYAETTEEPESTTVAADDLDYELPEDIYYYDVSEESGERVKRGAPSGQPNRNSLGQITNRLQGFGRFSPRGPPRAPQGGQGGQSQGRPDEHLQGGPGIIPAYRPAGSSPQAMEAMARQRARDIEQHRWIMNNLSRDAAMYRDKGMSPRRAHDRVASEQRLLMAELSILKQRNADFDVNF